MKKVSIFLVFTIAISMAFAGVKELQVTEVSLPKFGTYQMETESYYQSVNRYEESESSMEGKGFWGSLVAKFFPTGKNGTIYNLDEKMMYTIDFAKKTYSKTPIEAYFEDSDLVEDDEEEEEQVEEAEDSRYRIIRKELHIKKGKQRQKINQFEVSEYEIIYLLEKEEIETKKRLTDSLYVSVFASDDSKIFSKANQEKSSHQKAMMEAIGWKMEEEEYQEMLGVHWINLLSSMDNDMESTEMEIDYSELKKIQGHPVLVDGSYFVREYDPTLQVKAEKPKEKKKTGGFGLGKFMDKVVESVQDTGEDKTAEKNNQYQMVLSYKTETKELSFDSYPESLFSAPEDFKEVK